MSKKKLGSTLTKAKNFVKTRRLNTLLWSSLVGLALVGCSNRDPHFALQGRSQGFIAAPLNKKVDILWVIDNSGTMGPKQTNLANSINSFMDQFMTKDFDYQISVITTDTRTVAAGGQESCAVGATPIITPSTSNPDTTLATNAQVGNFGDAAAKSLDAVKNALSAPNVTGCNNGFLRSGAFLAVVFFSDADDNDSVTSTADLLTFLDTVKPPSSTPNGGSVRSFFTAAMVAPDANSADCQALGPFTETGTKFLSLATSTSAPSADICQPDFSAGLLAVGNRILEATTAVRLASIPNESTIEVYINGGGVPNDASDGWTYDSSTNSIVFHGSAIPSGSSNYITVNFVPFDVVR